MAYMEDSIKFHKAINTLKPDVEYTYHNDVPITEELFNKIEWKTGEDSEGKMISTTTCPHSEITWTALKTEMDKL